MASPTSSIPYTWPSTPPRGDSSTQPEPPGLSEAARASLQARAALTPEQRATQSTARIALIEEWRKQDRQERCQSPGPANARNTESPRAPMALASVFLSTEQQRVLQAVLHGESLFFTGSAGGNRVWLVAVEVWLGLAYASFWGGTGTQEVCPPAPRYWRPAQEVLQAARGGRGHGHDWFGSVQCRWDNRARLGWNQFGAWQRGLPGAQGEGAQQRRHPGTLVANVGLGRR
ncbi:hypothetical protein K439DRAFT_1625511 [Ramaria rubella]|nr:hypothetical protein K439DRAFT_1625511 [Ramaria rubella]